MFAVWVIFHVIICVALVIVVLMQSSKGEGLAGGTAFGGGVSNAVFGGRGAASFLSKATTVLAVVFFVNCGALALMSADTSVGVVSGDGSAVESSVTRQAQAEREQALERQQSQMDAALQDSLAQQNAAGVQTFNFDGVDESEATPETPAADDASTDN